VEIAGETNPLEIQMPLIVGTVPLHREFSKLQPAMTKDRKNHAPPLILQTMDTKYRKLRKLCYEFIFISDILCCHTFKQINRYQELKSFLLMHSFYTVNEFISFNKKKQLCKYYAVVTCKGISCQ
jgi:hypothetical protein